MQSLLYAKTSDGTANASLMTVQTLRSPGATTAIVNTVSGVPAGGFYASMGAPHTFTDPITSEVITVISDATAVDFAGHINAGQVIIDAIAPGYVDTRGSLVGDIIIIRPVSEWANNIFNVLNQSLNTDGTLKTSAITYQPIVFDHVASGAVLAGINYGTTLTASLTAGVCYINGLMQTISAVATRTYTASKDTYVDALYSSTGTATIVYTEVANNAVSPALAANSIRLGIVVTGVSNIAAAGSVNQGQEDRILPVVSSVNYSVADGLGNLICPRDPNRRVLNYKQILANQTGIGGSPTQITGFTLPVIVPLGRKIHIRVVAWATDNSNAAPTTIAIWDGVVSVGTQIGSGLIKQSAAGNGTQQIAEIEVTPSTTSKTYNISLTCSGGGTAGIYASAGNVSFAKVELA